MVIAHARTAQILHVRDELIGQKGRTQADPISEASAGFESLHLAVFYSNALYGFLTLVFAWFVLKVRGLSWQPWRHSLACSPHTLSSWQDVNTYINYAIASVVPAFIVLLLASMDASKKKSKL
jgi:hypothetical protein